MIVKDRPGTVGPGRLAVAIVGALVLSGCIVPADRGNVGPVSGAGARPSAEPRCYNLVTHLDDWTPKTIALQASVSSTIFVGTLKGRQAAFWNTPDGLAPPSERAFGNAKIVTPITVAVDRVIRGEPADAARAALSGGIAGCSSWTFNPPPTDPENGGRYLFFAQSGFDSTRSRAAFTLVWQAWPVTSQDLVQTPEEGPIFLADVAAEIERYPLLAPGEPLPWPSSPPEPSPTVDTFP